MLQKIITLLFVSGDPLPIKTIASILSVTDAEIQGALPSMSESLSQVGLALLSTEEGLSLVTQAEYSSVIELFWKEEMKGELTPAALQVLTLVAYLGNPTREEISYIRGVQSSQSVRALCVRGLIKRQGEVCTLTDDSLKQLGITSVSMLPDYESIHKDLRNKIDTREL